MPLRARLSDICTKGQLLRPDRVSGINLKLTLILISGSYKVLLRQVDRS